MEIEPPQPSDADTRELRRGGRGYLATTLIWFGVLLAVTLIVWMVLWSGGLRQAVPTDEAASAGQRP